MLEDGLKLVCPRCRVDVSLERNSYFCARCASHYPVINGIPDFRLHDDPYIRIEPDRRKAEGLFEVSRTRNFRQMLDYYYSITPEDPRDLAVHWTAHALAGAGIAEFHLQQSGLPAGGSFLDVGCSTGGMLVAAQPRFSSLVGVDVALRWLTIGLVRLREAGVTATLICANAEALPFAGESFNVVTVIDLMEHARDAGQVATEVYRTCRSRAHTLWITNNRYAPLPEPQVGIWGVGYLPRRWQPGFVAKRRPDLLRYRIRMLGPGELSRLIKRAGFASVRTGAAPLVAPHHPSLEGIIKFYNELTRWPVTARLLRCVGPKLRATAQRPQQDQLYTRT